MNFGDLFDSPWKILIVAVVIIVLFGSKKLPHAVRQRKPPAARLPCRLGPRRRLRR
ncbi:MAG TPA: twin-arginine translocase TatA/TatE family subunit [Streptosporangiaceae bacterium]|nr:twin-arginine translocase TatA/TatE family subunit [Streptosporangiaceae bacterium]